MASEITTNGFTINSLSGDVIFLRILGIYILELKAAAYTDLTTLNIKLNDCFYTPLRKLITDAQRTVTVYTTLNYGRTPFKTAYSVNLPYFDILPAETDANLATYLYFSPNSTAAVAQYDYKDMVITVTVKIILKNEILRKKMKKYI
jgi:hypothetical protein